MLCGAFNFTFFSWQEVLNSIFQYLSSSHKHKSSILLLRSFRRGSWGWWVTMSFDSAYWSWWWDKLNAQCLNFTLCSESQRKKNPVEHCYSSIYWINILLAFMCSKRNKQCMHSTIAFSCQCKKHSMREANSLQDISISSFSHEYWSRSL